MTFNETLALLNWAKTNNARHVVIDGVTVEFGPTVPPEDRPTAPPKKRDVRAYVDEQLFGQRLPESNNG